MTWSPFPARPARVTLRDCARHHELAAEGEIPLLGLRLFIGEIHGSDFYNRVPVEARIGGIRRFGPARLGRDRGGVPVDHGPHRAAAGAAIVVALSGNGLGYNVSPDAPMWRPSPRPMNGLRAVPYPSPGRSR